MNEEDKKEIEKATILLKKILELVAPEAENAIIGLTALQGATSLFALKAGFGPKEMKSFFKLAAKNFENEYRLQK